MKKLLPLTLILGVSFIQTATSADYFLGFGAGGEEEKADTIFDPALHEMGNFLKKSSIVQGSVAINGGHSVTEGIVLNEFPSKVEKTIFLGTDYEALISKYKKKLENNEIGPGDQFMIYIDSHGAEKTGDSDTHKIATGASGALNLNTLAGAHLVDLDRLKDLRDLAKAKGVRMAIIDASCHSGNTISLGDDNTCVISATGPNHYGYGPFSTGLLRNMQNSKNLEEAFLKTRADDQTPNYPMISTPAGLATNAAVYDQLTPFFYHFDNKDDKLMPYLLSHHSEEQMCIANQNYSNLLNTINNIEELNTVTKKALFWNVKTKEVDLSQLKYLLDKYKKTQDQIALQMQDLDIDRLKTKETINVSARLGNIATNYKQDVTWGEMINSDYDKLIQQMGSRVANTTSEALKVTYMGTLSFYAQAKAKKEEILKQYPQLTNIPAKQAALKENVDSTYFTNSAIAVEERKLYEALYKKNSTDPNLKGSNPCQNFKL